MAPISPCFYSYAVALNNMAVSLLQQHCYEQAIVTLIEAVKLFRIESRQRESQLSSDVMDTNELSLLYRRACRRLARPRPEVLTESGLHFEVVSEDEGFPAIAVASDQPCSTSGTTFLFRIEGCGNLGLDSSMVLHNYGMAFICLATVSSSVTESRWRLDHSRKILKLALGAIMNQNDDSEIESTVSASIIVLRSLVSLSIDLDSTHEAKRYEWQLRNCMEERLVVENLLGKRRSLVAAAAA